MAVNRGALRLQVLADLRHWHLDAERGRAWLMVLTARRPGLCRSYKNRALLSCFQFALLAVSAGNIFDRRRLVLITEVWMMRVALILAILTMVGLTSPWLLLARTFALSAGDAFETPTWGAVLSELVSKDDLAAASALNGIEFNLARAVGPVLASGKCDIS